MVSSWALVINTAIWPGFILILVVIVAVRWGAPIGRLIDRIKEGELSAGPVKVRIGGTDDDKAAEVKIALEEIAENVREQHAERPVVTGELDVVLPGLTSSLTGVVGDGDGDGEREEEARAPWPRTPPRSLRSELNMAALRLSQRLDWLERMVGVAADREKSAAALAADQTRVRAGLPAASFLASTAYSDSAYLMTDEYVRLVRDRLRVRRSGPLDAARAARLLEQPVAESSLTDYVHDLQAVGLPLSLAGEAAQIDSIWRGLNSTHVPPLSPDGARDFIRALRRFVYIVEKVAGEAAAVIESA